MRDNIEIKLLEFKPSVIAASALISAAHELFPIQSPSFRSAIASSHFVNKVRFFPFFSLFFFDFQGIIYLFIYF